MNEITSQPPLTGLDLTGLVGTETGSFFKLQLFQIYSFDVLFRIMNLTFRVQLSHALNNIETPLEKDSSCR